MNKEEILNVFLLSNIPEIITQEEFNDVKKAIKQLQEENQELKEELKQIKTEPLTNRISRIDSVIANIYKENQQLKEQRNIMACLVNDLQEVLDEIREYIEKHKMLGCDEFEYISTSPDTMLQILDKVNEQKW